MIRVDNTFALRQSRFAGASLGKRPSPFQNAFMFFPTREMSAWRFVFVGTSSPLATLPRCMMRIMTCSCLRRREKHQVSKTPVPTPRRVRKIDLVTTLQTDSERQQKEHRERQKAGDEQRGEERKKAVVEKYGVGGGASNGDQGTRIDRRPTQ